MKFSILTATYNRGCYLKKLYESIVRNASNKYQIEWLIMDDGSTDNTESIVKDFLENKIEIKYFKQKNGGKMNAINNLMKYVVGEVWIECDSDDFFCNGVFEKIINDYEVYKNRNDIYALAYLKFDQNEINMGNYFVIEKTKMFDLYFKYGEYGEKALVFFSKVRAKFKYELEDGEKFITEAYMYHKMDKEYSIICRNIPIMICEYRDDGYSKNIMKQYMSNPQGYYKYFHQILNDVNIKGILFKKRLYVIRQYIMFCYLTKRKCNARGIINKILIFIFYIPYIIYYKIRCNKF